MIEDKWTEEALSDYEFWKKCNPNIAERIDSLIKNIKQTPYSGLGKPKKLRYSLSNVWSRRIDKEHRILYIYYEEHGYIEIIKCKGHYDIT